MIPKHPMETHGRQRTARSSAYRIVVRAEIGERFAAAFEGMDVRIADGQTIITGQVIDQSHLHGILDRIHAFGLELVSVQPVPEAYCEKIRDVGKYDVAVVGAPFAMGTTYRAGARFGPQAVRRSTMPTAPI
jgi:hypothetical protein